MASKDALTSLGAQDKANLLKKSAKTLPANASDKGFSAEQIIKSMYEPSLTNFLYMQRLITELGGIFDSLDAGIGGKVDKVAGKSLISDTEITRLSGMESGAQVNVIEGVQVNGVDLTPTNKKVNVDISGKVDKVSSANKVYVTDDTGAQASAGYDTYVDGDFVRRNDDNQIYVPATPTATTHAASKGYVDGFGKTLTLTVNGSTYVMTLTLKDKNGNALATQTVDLPLETMVVNGEYNSSTKKIILTLKNGNSVEFSIADLISGLVPSTRKIAGVDLDDDVTKVELQAALDMDYSLSSAELEDIFTDPVEEEEEENE